MTEKQLLVSALLLVFLISSMAGIVVQAQIPIPIVRLNAVNINGGDTNCYSTSITLTLTTALYVNAHVDDTRYFNAYSLWSDWEPWVATRQYSLPPGGVEGVPQYKEITCQYRLSTGVLTDTFSDSIYYIQDTVAPTGSIVINSGNNYTNSRTVTLTLSANDATSGVSQMRFYETAWSAWVTYANTYTYTLTSANDGAKTISAQFKDNAGLVSSSSSDTIVLDTSAPTGSISINGGADYTTSTSVTLSLTYSDATTSVTIGEYSNDMTNWLGWAAPVATKAWTLSSGDGTKTVYYKMWDAAANTAYRNDTIVLDTVAPIGSISINSGAISTDSISVTLSLTYSDATSGVSQVRYSNDAVWDTEVWESPTTSKTWTLTPGDGLKTVSFQVRDKAGLTSTTFSDFITLSIPLQKVAAPTFSPVGGSYSSAQSVTVSCGTAGATVRFTVDGSEPSASSTQYSSAISVGVSMTIKAKAFKSGMTDSDAASATYTIEKPNVDPVASFTFSPSSQEIGKAVSFDGSGSSDSDGSITSYAWNFGDEGTSSDVKPSHSYSSSGTFMVSLTVTDDKGAKNTAKQQVTITSEPEFRFEVAASSDKAGVKADELAILTASASGGSGSWVYQWYEGTVPITGETHSALQVKRASAGNYTFFCRVTDTATGASQNTNQVAIMVSEIGPGEGTPLWVYAAGVGGLAAVAGSVMAFKFLRRPKKLPVPSQLRITADPTTLIADGETRATITMQLLDKQGNPMPALADTQVRVNAGKGTVESPVVTIPKGKVMERTVLVSSMEAGAVPVSAMAEGLKSITITLNFVERPRYCMHCGTQMASKARACKNCGLMPPAGTDTKLCPKCDSVIPIVAKFCGECGTGQAV